MAKVVVDKWREYGVYVDARVGSVGALVWWRSVEAITLN